jgi:hypothetical protein
MVAMVYFEYRSGVDLVLVLFLLIAVARGIQLVVRESCEARHGIRLSTFWSRLWFWPGLIVIAVGTVLMIQREFPMHLSIALSRTAMDEIADEALADPANAHRLAGRWAGFYRIDKVEVLGRTVVLGLGKYFGSDQYGFVRIPGMGNAVPDRMDFRRNPKDRSWDPEAKRIVDDWFVLYSSYWLEKDGWS